MNNKIKIPVSRLRQIIQEEVSTFYEIDGMEDTETEQSSENTIEEIDRDDYAYNTNNTFDFAESEDLEPLLSGTKFESLEIIDGSNRRKIEEFTYGNQDGSMILPLKKKDGFIYFKTNEKSDDATQGKYYKISEEQSDSGEHDMLEEEEIEEVTTPAAQKERIIGALSAMTPDQVAKIATQSGMKV